MFGPDETGIDLLLKVNIQMAYKLLLACNLQTGIRLLSSKALYSFPSPNSATHWLTCFTFFWPIGDLVGSCGFLFVQSMTLFFLFYDDFKDICFCLGEKITGNYANEIESLLKEHQNMKAERSTLLIKQCCKLHNI